MKRYVTFQNRTMYEGTIKVLVIDNNSTDDTIYKAKITSKKLKLPVRVVKEKEVGKFNA